MFELYRVVNDYAQRQLEAGYGQKNRHEYTLVLHEGLVLSWTTGLSCLHPTFLGLPCIEGTFYGTDLKMDFMVLTELRKKLRPINLTLSKQDQVMYRLSFLLKDQDSSGDLLVYPLCAQAESFLVSTADLEARDLILSFLSTIMTSIFGFQYSNHAEDSV